MALRTNHDEKAVRENTRSIWFQLVALLIVAVVSFALGARWGRKPHPRVTDFSSSNSVSVVLGDPATEYGGGLQHIHFENDGLTTPTLLDGVPCRQLKLASGEFGYIYFTIDPTFKRSPLRSARIEVEYCDPQRGTLTLHYDASQMKTNANPPYTDATPSVLLHGSKTWQTALFYVENATFKNAQNSRADFRLCVTPPELYVRRVTVQRAAR